MKLNLLPTYVGKGRQVVLALFVGVILIVVSAAFSFTMITNSHRQLAQVQAQAHDYEGPVNSAKEYAEKADNVVAPLKEITRDINLAIAMNAHNDVFLSSTTRSSPIFQVSSESRAWLRNRSTRER